MRRPCGQCGGEAFHEAGCLRGGERDYLRRRWAEARDRKHEARGYAPSWRQPAWDVVQALDMVWDSVQGPMDAVLRPCACCHLHGDGVEGGLATDLCVECAVDAKCAAARTRAW